jgi:hypothetical protein
MYPITKLISFLYSSESESPDGQGSITSLSRRLDVLEDLLLREDTMDYGGLESTLVNVSGRSTPQRTQISGRTSNCSLACATISVQKSDSGYSDESTESPEQNHTQSRAPTATKARHHLTTATGASSLEKRPNRLDRQSLQGASAAPSPAQAPVARLLHVYSLAAMLRGLPADITAAEAADIRAALPPAVLADSPLHATADDRPGKQQPAAAAAARSLPRRLAAALTHRLLGAVLAAARGAGPCFARGVRRLRRLDARWGVSRRVGRWAGREGPAGRAVRWAVVGVAEGIVEGLGRGWAGEEVDAEGEERGRRRTSV